MGVSYKTGIIDSKLKQPSEVYALKPIDLSAGFSYFALSSTDEKILTIWDSCELYFYRCLMRYDVLETALATPAQDLGMQNVERCRGFSAHLLVRFHSFVFNILLLIILSDFVPKPEKAFNRIHEMALHFARLRATTARSVRMRHVYYILNVDQHKKSSKFFNNRNNSNTTHLKFLSGRNEL